MILRKSRFVPASTAGHYQLGFALDAFLFIDDHPIEGDRVRKRILEVEVWGENPFDLRRALLDARLLPRITAKTAARPDLGKA